MTRSDEIRNTGGVESQTPETRILNHETHEGGTKAGEFSHRGYGENGDDTSEKPSPEKKNDQQLNPRKPNLSPEQQEWLNRVFIPNFRRELIKNLKGSDMKTPGRKTAENEPETKSAGAAGAVLNQIIAEKDRTIEDIRSSDAKERERLLGIISEVKIDREIVASASRQNSVHPSQVAQLLKKSVRLNDEMATVVLDDDGETAINGEGKLMTIDEMVKSFLDENPHFVRPSSVSGGSGSADSSMGQAHSSAMTSSDLIGAALREERKQHAQARR
jgi:hypothetical protein